VGIFTHSTLSVWYLRSRNASQECFNSIKRAPPLYIIHSRETVYIVVYELPKFRRYDVHGSRKRRDYLVHLEADAIQHRDAQLPRGELAAVPPPPPPKEACEFAAQASCTGLVLIHTLIKLDIEGLNITVTSGPPTRVKGSSSSNTTATSGKKVAKGKARSEGTEILHDATLRLKAGQRYALVGRNGSGKSSKSSRPKHWLFPPQGAEEGNREGFGGGEKGVLES
jgi:ABC-type multidrug transport system fused ATPase/permease subunit